MMRKITKLLLVLIILSGCSHKIEDPITQKEASNNTGKEVTESSIQSEPYLTLSSTGEYPYTNEEYLKQATDIVIFELIEKRPTVVRDEKTDEILEPATPYLVKVVHVIKGDLKEGEEVEFRVPVARVPFDQYYESLTEHQKQRHDISKVPNDAVVLYLNEEFTDFVELVPNQTYLGYFKNEERLRLTGVTLRGKLH